MTETPPRPLRAVVLPIPDATWPVLQFRFPMTETEWQRLMTILEALHPGLIAEHAACPEDTGNPCEMIAAKV